MKTLTGHPPATLGQTFRRCSNSLLVRMAVVAVVFTLLGSLVRLTFLLPHIRDNLMELQAKSQLSFAQYIARDIDSKILTRLNVLGRLAGRLPPTLLKDPGRLEDWLREHHEDNPIFSQGLLVIPPDGHGAIAEFPPVPGRRGLDFAEQDFFLKAITEKAPVIGKPVRGRAQGIPLMIMAAPVLDGEGQVAAVLAGVTTLAAPGLFDLLEETRLGKTGGFLLISPQDNLFVAATDTSKTLTPLPPPGVNPVHDRAMAGYRGTGITVNSHGVEELSAMASVPTTGWFLAVRIPTEEAFVAIGNVRAVLIRNGLITSVVGAAIVVLVLYHFTRPLTSAARRIHRMAKGEIELQPVPMVRRDEVGELVEGFNFLLARLEEASAQKHQEERRRLAEKECLEQSLRHWMADTSHELRTPIAVLRAQIEAIQDGIHAADAGTLSVLHRQVMGMSQLVDDLHTLARSDVGELNCQANPVTPLGLVDDTVTSFRERYAAAGLEITWGDCPDVEPVVLGDACRLVQVFANLLENSRRYSDAGGGLRICCDADDHLVRIVFEDSPPGVPADALPRLFERFYRVDGSRSRDRGGSGIGLAVCKSIVTAHGGSISAAASPLGGLRVTVTLPRMEGA